MKEREQRMYARTSHFHTEATISADGVHYALVQAEDLSSRGVKIYDMQERSEGDVLQIDMRVHGVMTEFSVKANVRIAHKSIRKRGGFCYGLVFLNLPRDVAIRIDENVRKDRPISGEHYHPKDD